MMLAMNGEPSEVDAFLFVLAEKLGKSVSEIRCLPALEILQWNSYFKVQSALRKANGGG